MRKFNTTGTCYPQIHYMVDITERLNDIANRVADGEYITINRGRQYGKTTTLYHLTQRLSKDYVVFSISFEQMGKTEFATEESLTYYFLDRLRLKLRTLIIDEVDSASNYESFIKLLRLLRDKYLNRMDEPTFQSVILAGVYDIKNLKLKVRPDSDHQYNSPWNIAVPFKADMSFAKNGIEQMLTEYETDHNTGMDISEMAQLIFDYSSGYPFFVSKLSQLIDEEQLGWNKEGLLKAVNILSF